MTVRTSAPHRLTHSVESVDLTVGEFCLSLVHVVIYIYICRECDQASLLAPDQASFLAPRNPLIRDMGLEEPKAMLTNMYCSSQVVTWNFVAGIQPKEEHTNGASNLLHFPWKDCDTRMIGSQAPMPRSVLRRGTAPPSPRATQWFWLSPS